MQVYEGIENDDLGEMILRFSRLSIFKGDSRWVSRDSSEQLRLVT